MKTFLRAAALLLLCAVLRAEDVVILTGETGPLQDLILAGLRKTLTASYKEVPAAGDLAAALGPDVKVVVALSAGAADRAHLHSAAPLVVTGVPNLYDKSWKDAVKVHVDVRPEDVLKALKETGPAVKTVGMIHTPDKSPLMIAKIKQAAAAAGVAVMDESCDSTGAIAEALRRMDGKVDAFWMVMDPLSLHPVAVDLVFQFASTQKLLLIAPLEPYVQKGAAMALAADYMEVGTLAGEAAQAALHRSARSDFFVKNPQMFLNAAALGRAGISPTDAVRAKAKRVY